MYQDLFQEGSFIGKGIYEVDAFERALAGRFPENRILSHDLLESVYARCGLVSDIKFYEEYPSRYELDVVRRHRWIRGDWQIMPWLFPRVPGAAGPRIPNPISVLSWWKIFDNLRRSLVPIALLLFLLQWLSCRSSALAALRSRHSRFARFRPVESLRKRKRCRGRCTWTPWARPWPHLQPDSAHPGFCLTTPSLVWTDWPHPYARVRDPATSFGMARLSDVARTARTDLAGSYAAMWFGPAIALVGGMLLAFTPAGRWYFALPYFVLWLAAPWIAWWISQPPARVQSGLGAEQLLFLRRIARKTWLFLGLSGLATACSNDERSSVRAFA